MNVLIVNTWLPFPPDDGAKMTVYNTARHLARRGHNVTLVAFRRQGTATPAVDIDGLQTRSIALPDRPPLSVLLRGALGPQPYGVVRYSSREMAHLLETILREQTPDVVNVHHVHMAQYCSVLKRGGAPALVLNEHNVETDVLRSYAAESRHVAGRLYAQNAAAKMSRFETRALPWFDIVTAVSPGDVATLNLMNANADIRCLPPGIDTEYFKPGLEPEDAGSVVVVGSMDWYPNADGARWFVEDIWPLVLRRRPEAVLHIVGRNPPRNVRDLASAAIQVHGSVPDVRPYIARSAVFVAPIRSGAGLKVKLLTAMAMGKAIVATPFASLGLPIESEHNALIGKDTTEFAGHVVRLLSDIELRRRLGSQARASAHSDFSWEIITEKTVSLFEEAIGKRHGR